VPALNKAARELEDAIKTKSNNLADKIQDVNKAIDELLMDGETALDQEWR